ncbi:copine-5-like isoform X9 [Malurus melanocephalus]|uniref:copine-5-like isoform X9 n=1 Tax=Malurus melanocephalus TaxID=175006 RepID=UPI00254776F7|nr:copine-5-like isoform X9 [Malurus melanocephalus]
MSTCSRVPVSPCPHPHVPLPPSPCSHLHSNAPVLLCPVFTYPSVLMSPSPHPKAPMSLISMSTYPCAHITTSSCLHVPVVLSSHYLHCPHVLQFGRTEVIDNSLNPDFLRKFVLDYYFEERQNLRFDLYDVDSKSPDLSKHDFLGQAFCTLGEIVGSAGSRLEKPLTMGTAIMQPRGRRPAPATSNGGIPGKKCGTIIVLAEELGNCRDVATLQFCANKLDKKDFFGKSDPFMVFYRSNEDGTFTICHKTEVVRNTLNPIWAAFAIPVRALCNGDHDRAIKVEVYDWDRDGSHDFIGEFTTSYRELARGQSCFNVYEVVNPRKKMKKKKYLNSGTVTLLSFTVEAEHTFLDYIKGGTQLNFTVAIDFTASNAHVPALPEPLPAECLQPGTAGRGGHHPGLRQRQDVPSPWLWCQGPPGWARVPRVPTGCQIAHVHHHCGGRPGRVRCHGGAGWGRHPHLFPWESG